MNCCITFMIALSMIIQPYCKGMENCEEIKTKLSHVIVNEYFQPTLALLAILQAAQIKHNGTLQDICAKTQKAWLRTAGLERWENKNNPILHSNNTSELFKNLALVQEIQPSNQHYNYVALLGATTKSVRKRVAYLIKLWNSGVRFDSIVVLSGQRPLDKAIESPEILLQNSCPTFPFKKDWQLKGQLPSTETEMIKLVFDQADLPEELNTIPLFFIDAPMQKTENGTLRRPNTFDTIQEWLKMHNPQKGSILAVSQQPTVGYQDAVLRSCLQQNFTIETVGGNCLAKQKIPTILDSLARWIYNEYQIYKTTGSFNNKT